MKKQNYIPSNIKHELILWVWEDCILRYKRPVLSSFFLKSLHLFAQFGSYAVLFFYVNALESGKVLNLFNYSYDVLTSGFLFSCISTIVSLLFIATAIFEYFSKKIAIQSAKRYEQFCSQRLFVEISQLKYPQIIVHNPLLAFRNIQKSTFKDVRFLGRIHLIFFEIFFTCLNLIGSFLFLVYISPLLAFIILLLTTVAFFRIWHTSQSVFALTNSREEMLPDYIRQKKHLLMEALTSTTMNIPLTYDILKKKEQKNGIQKQYNLFYGRLIAQQQNTFNIKILIGICTIGILLIVGNLIFHTNQISWTVFIAFAFALRFFFGGLNMLQGVVNNISRSYDFVKNYWSILKTIQKLKNNDNYIPSKKDLAIYNQQYSVLNNDDDDDE